MAKKKEELTLEEKIERAIVPKDEQPYEIPSNWVWTRFNDISILSTGNSINENEKKEKYINLDEGYNYIGTKDVLINCEINYENGVKIPYNESKFRIAKKNSSLLCIEGGSSGRKKAFLTQDVCYGNKLCSYTMKDGIEKYLFFYLCSNHFYKMFNESKNGLIGGVSLNKLKILTFPLPPLKEQERIVKKVESMLEKVKEAKEIIKDVKEKSSLRKESLLNKAFTGELTSKWRAENECSSAITLLEKINEEKLKKWKEECKLAESEGKKKPKKPVIKSIEEMIVPLEEQPYEIPSNWVWTRLGEVSEIISKGTTPKGGNSSYIEKGINFLRAENITNDILSLENCKYIDEECHNNFLKRSILKDKDILITIAGTLGRCSIVEEQHLPANTNQAVSFVRLQNLELVKPEYIQKNIISSVAQKILMSSVKITTIPNLTLEIIGNFTFPLPPLEEQQEIVKVLDKILEKEKEIEELCTIEEKLELLEKSILDKAFRGELGTNDLTDEPAIELLKKIKMEEK